MATASSVPNADLISCFSTASSVSPYLSFNFCNISGVVRSWLFASTNDRPNFSPALAAVFKNDLYFVAASDPLIVVWSCPKIASCSSMDILLFVAVAPNIEIALAISEPAVL